MNTKLLVSLCAAFALMAACNKPHDKDATATPDTAAPPPADTAAPPPADTAPPPADATQPPASDEKPANPPPQ